VQADRAPIPCGKVQRLAPASLATDVLKALDSRSIAGRLDESEHPVHRSVPGDIRVTTPFDRERPLSGFTGAVHETGHAMYDLGLPLKWRDQPVGLTAVWARGKPALSVRNEPVPAAVPSCKYLKPLLEKILQVSGPEWSEDNLYGISRA